MAQMITNHAYLIPVFPFIAFLIIILTGRKLGERLSAYVSIAAAATAFAFSLSACISVFNKHDLYFPFTWMILQGKPFTFGVAVDPLTAVMLMVVTIVGTLIQIYSIGYMAGDPRKSRFFAYLSLFTTSMLGLVLADNFMMLYIFWELVGLCSYLLISFWFEKVSAAEAGKKAFITTRIGDCGFFIGIAMLFYLTGTVNFKELPNVVHLAGPLLTVAAVLIFCGAIGKSAQFPLHVWLPDAMEGPTPVSALIHAATMVAAGVYMVARAYVIFATAHQALLIVAYIGIITAVMAATIALVNNDIKRILAYSTISQLGYMMVGLGVGGYSAGVFHLMTHAFFKALLFLGAGSVIHSVHTQDIRKMGGLLPKMKITASTFIIASLSISGIPPLSGFWSKDEILASAYQSGHLVIFSLAALTSLLTAFYMFRLCFLAFFGKPRAEIHPALSAADSHNKTRKGGVHAHESPLVMTVPLMILALFSIFIGLIGSPYTGNWFGNFIARHDVHTLAHAHHEGGLNVMLLSTIIAVSGIALAFCVYMLNIKFIPQAIRSRFGFLYNLLYNKYYFDEIYGALIIKPFFKLTERAFAFDIKVIDGAVNGAGALTLWASNAKNAFDKYVVDGAVNGAGYIVGFSSSILRRLQNGLVQSYLVVAVVGILIVIFLL